MTPPIFSLCYTDTTVQSFLGDGSKLRFYPFGEAAENEQLPYATWQLVGGAPENYLGTLPDIDSLSTQVDVFAKTASEAREIAEAIRDVVEISAYVTSWDGESRDAATRSYRHTFTVDWFVSRN
jgi:hypothetical protein